MSDNLKLWNKLARPPAEALKKIKGGRLSGMTDISPQWRIKIMTEVFGPIGFGWTYTIENLWTVDGSEGQVCVFAEVEVTYDDENGDPSSPIPGIGGNMLIAKELKGLYTCDEAYKMAVTDALGVALKTLGVGADIYFNKWDGSKYRDEAPEQTESQATTMYNDMKNRIEAAGFDDEKLAEAMGWLDGCIKTTTGMNAAKRMLDERLDD